MGDVIKLKPNVIENNDFTASDSIDDINRTGMKISSKKVPSFQQRISTNDLYPLSAELNHVLSRALNLLQEGVRHLDDALSALLEDDDAISSDDALQRFQALLPELFCCRDLGDGFGVIVSSTYHALRNLFGTPLNENQLRTVRSIVQRLYTEPYIAFDEAVDEINSLEEVGLEVTPSYFKYVADFLNEL